MPTFLDVLQPGDPVEFGLRGEPAFPERYKGAGRPQAVVTSISGPKGERVAELKLTNGSTRLFHEGDSSPMGVFEPTDAGYRGIMAREEAVAAEYRNSQTKDTASKTVSSAVETSASVSNERVEKLYRGIEKLESRLHGAMDRIEQQNRVLIHISSGLAQDLDTLYRQVGSVSEPTFSGTLLDEMKHYRGMSDDASQISKIFGSEVSSAVSQ